MPETSVTTVPKSHCTVSAAAPRTCDASLDLFTRKSPRTCIIYREGASARVALFLSFFVMVEILDQTIPDQTNCDQTGTETESITTTQNAYKCKNTKLD